MNRFEYKCKNLEGKKEENPMLNNILDTLSGYGEFSGEIEGSIEELLPTFSDELPVELQYLKEDIDLKNINIIIGGGYVDMRSKEGEAIGGASVEFDSIEGKEVLKIEYLSTEQNFQNKKYGSLLIELLNALLDEIEIVGILENDAKKIGNQLEAAKKSIITGSNYEVSENNFSGFYQRHRWIDIGNGIMKYSPNQK